MKVSILALSAAVGLSQAAPRHSPFWIRADQIQGFDISNHQPEFDYEGAYEAGARFAMMKSSEGTGYSDPYFSQHWEGCTAAGILRGGYHFALPDSSSAADQVAFFLENGGGWTADNKTLPGMLDIEYNPYGDTCYGLSTSEMTAWIQEFVDEYYKETNRYPMIYTTYDWWNKCTGNAGGFEKSALVQAGYSSTPPSTIPGDWETYDIWQNTNKYEFGGDGDLFQGTMSDLMKLVSGK